MPLKIKKVPLPKAAGSVVVRPRATSNGNSVSPQVLVIFDTEIRELLEIIDDSGRKTYQLSELPLPVAGQMRGVTAAMYEPNCDCVFLIVGNKAIKRLDSNNTVTLVAGSETEYGIVDGCGGAARFRSIAAMAADGKGNVFVAEGGGVALSRIRVLRVGTGEVTTLRGSQPPRGDSGWVALSYDAAADVLLAATWYGVCHVLMYGSSKTGLGLCAAVRLLAGSWVDGEEDDEEEDDGEAARFSKIKAVLAGADSRVLVCDSIGANEMMKLCTLEADGAVGRESIYNVHVSETWNMTILSGGELAACAEDVLNEDDNSDNNSVLAVISGGGFAPSSEALGGWRHLVPPADLAARLALPGYLALPSSDSDKANSGSLNPVVTVRAGGGKAFTAHRSVLAACSEYLQRKLAEDAGFGDSGGAEVSLPDAHPEAFGWLLSYCYTGTLDVPAELLRPAAELAGRLLLPADCVAQLQARLLFAATPQSVVSDLVWAEQHGMAELVPRLKAYLLRHRKCGGGAGAARRAGGTGRSERRARRRAHAAADGGVVGDVEGSLFRAPCTVKACSAGLTRRGAQWIGAYRAADMCG